MCPCACFSCREGSYLRESRALHVFYRLEIASQLFCGLGCDRLLFVLGELLDGGGIVAQVDLRAHQQEGGLGAVVSYFRHPLQEEGRGVPKRQAGK